MWFVIPGVPQPELVLSETTRTSALPVTRDSNACGNVAMWELDNGDKFVMAIEDILVQ